MLFYCTKVFMNFHLSIIGAGAVGLATAYRVLQAHPGLKIAVIDKEDEVAKHQTGNNSGVIHSGIYYKPGSLKAINCRIGYEQLISFAEEHDVSFDICGKIIVATEQSELPALETIYQRGKANGLSQVQKISKEEVREIEPHVSCIAALKVPETGIINYKQVSQKMASWIQHQGGEILLQRKVLGITNNPKEIVIHTDAGDIKTQYLVSCAGLYADKLAQMTHPDISLKIIPFRGEYYRLQPEKQHLVKHLIYPVPDSNFPFLGVHFTRMIEGGIEAGPNAVFAFKREGYKNTDIDFKELSEILLYSGFRKVAFKYWRTGWMEMKRSYSKHLFTQALKKLIPEIEAQDLAPGGAGVRAQACDAQGNLLDDFSIFEASNIIHVCNAPSPAATSCLSIGKTIADKISKQMKA